MRWILAVCLIASVGALPAIDFVYCPDGCTNANRPQCAWQTDAGIGNGACGLCVNAVAVHGAVMPVQPIDRLTRLGTPAAFDPASIPPHSIDRPPRHS
jgi:hypothetical protein